MADRFSQPHDVSDILAAFPSGLGGLMPGFFEIPANFRDQSGDAESRPWLEFQRTWFFDGIDPAGWRARPGVDVTKAWRHLSVIQRSWDPTHEHKTAAVAWLASRWLEAVV
jgi:hypothetical protein